MRYLRSVVCWALVGWAGAAAAAEDVPILNMSGRWRAFYVYTGPVVRDGDKLTRVGMENDTPTPPRRWREVDFDDGAWHRLRGQPFQPAWGTWGTLCYRANAGFIGTDMSTAMQSLICLRGRFRVDDLSRVGDLRLSVEYRGGVVVYLNGREVARGHMPDGRIDPTTLADDYDLAVFVGDDGKPIRADHRTKDKDLAEAWSRIKRRVTDVKVPAGLLRKGVNVLAVEAHRAPYPRAFVDKVSRQRNEAVIASMVRSTCGLTGLVLTAPAGATGIRPNMVRPAGVQVWNASVFQTSPYDFGDPCVDLRPIAIVGCPNGSFSGKAMVGSTEPIKQLSVTAGKLVAAGTGATIPASAVRVLYGESPEAPAEVAVSVRTSTRGVWAYPRQPKEVYGAVVPILVTVRVPADAAAGEYQGQLTVRLTGADAVNVPVRLSVAGHALPAPADYETVVDLIQSPDTLAMHYKADLWSPRHWELIERSLKVLGSAGLDTMYLPMIAETHFGNAETMVRWKPKPGGGHDYDFSIVEKYMDLFEKHCGRPRIVCLYVWDMSLEGGTKWPLNLAYRTEAIRKAREANAGLGPQVTAIDPKTGQPVRLQLVTYTEAESHGGWQGLYDRFRPILRKRGLYDRTMLGICLDPKPTKEVVELFKRLMPGRPWMVQDHIYRPAEKIHGVPAAYQANVFLNFFSGKDLAVSHYGTKHPEIRLWFPRGLLPHVLPHNFRLLAERTIVGGYHGFGRIGGDFWPVSKGRSHREYGGLITSRYPKNASGALSMRTSFLAPGPDGPRTTLRFELLREGVQEAQARIFVEKNLLAGRITGELADRCRAMLRARNEAVLIGSFGKVYSRHRGKWWDVARRGYANTAAAGYRWYLASGQHARSRALHALAADVARAMTAPSPPTPGR